MDVQVGIPPPPPPPPPPPAFFAETASPPPQPTTIATTTTATVSVASPPTQDRIWLHPWTVTEMREHASQWSLAGDAGVLLYLEQFSDRLTQRADAIQQHLNQTVNAVKSTHTRVLNCLNEFTSLANTQFIENRVYDEDETANSTTDTSKKDEQSTEKSNTNNAEAQEKVLQRYVEAIQYGLAILDTHFERVEAKLDGNTNGRSSFVDDDEDGGVPLEPILEPKDPYILRPLPYLIGTTEFMQDDYVGLGDLLIEPDTDMYDAEQIEKLQSDDSALSGSDEDEEKEENDFQAQVTQTPIVPAGASITEASNRPLPAKTLLTDSDDDEDPFGISKNVAKIDSAPSKPAAYDDDFFDEEPKKLPPKPEKAFTLDSDDEDSSSFSPPTKPSQSIIKPDNTNDDFDDKASTASEKSEEPEAPKPKVMSELEKAVLRRRKALGDPDVPAGDNDDDDFGIKPTTTKAKTSSNEPSSNTISNLASQPLTAPPKISKLSIFGEDDDGDDNDIFNPKAKLPNVLPTTQATIPSTKSSQKKEKDMFDDDDDSDEGDIFSPKKKTSTPSSIPTKKNDPISTPQSTVVNKPKPIVLADVSDDDDFFGTKPTSVITKPTVNKKDESSSSDDDILPPPVSKPQPPPTTKTPAATISDDEDPLTTVKSPPTKVTTTPVVLPTNKKSAPKSDDDDDSSDDMFGKPKKPATTATPQPPKVVPPVKPVDDDDDLFVPTKTTKIQVLPPNPLTAKPPVHSDDDDDLFPSKSSPVKSPPTLNTKSVVSDDPLGIGMSVEPKSPPTPVVQQTKPLSIPAKKSPSSDDDEENSPPEKELNPGALEEGEKIDVKKLASRMKFNPGAIKPGGFRPTARPKTNSITEDSPKPSVEDDDQPIENNPPAPAIGKKTPKVHFDSDEDDELFNTSNKKTIEPPKDPVPGPKEKTTNANENGKTNIKKISGGLNFTPRMPGDQPKPPPKETNNDTQKTSNEEPVVDKTMINMARDRTKVAARNRAPPSRRARPTGAAAAASTDDTDDLFATPKSTNTTKSPPTPTAAPVVSPPPPANVPVVLPPSVAVPVVTPPSVPTPVTGLPNKPAAIAAKQTNLKEKKKFSLFDSDDSEIDELLFGSSTKKNKSSVTPKATTTTTPKSTTKASILPLDDENDDDFLSKRPAKKNTKPVVDGDDIFADVKSKGQPVNKAKKDWSILGKTDGTDDIFNDASTKSSSTTKPKATNGKTKPTKNFDDLFDDPLNISSK